MGCFPSESFIEGWGDFVHIKIDANEFAGTDIKKHLRPNEYQPEGFVFIRIFYASLVHEFKERNFEEVEDINQCALKNKVVAKKGLTD